MKAAIFDLDGVVSNHSKREHYVDVGPGQDQEWEKFYAELVNDELNDEIWSLMFHLQKDWDIVLLTGREEVHKNATIKWLNENFINSFSATSLECVKYRALIMRRSSDHRADFEVKEEYLNSIKLFYSEVIAFDDRDNNINMFKANDIPCFQFFQVS